MVNRMRGTRSHRDNRRSHDALSETKLGTCSSCGAPVLRHIACPACGKYQKRVVIDFAAAEVKRAKKAKAEKAR